MSLPTAPRPLWVLLAGACLLLGAIGLTVWTVWTGRDPDVANTALFGAWCVAMLLLFAVGLRLPLQARLTGIGLLTYTWGVVLTALLITLAGNAALYRHDSHYDLTRERLSTPSPEAAAVVENLTQDVKLTYFYQAQDPNGRRARELLEILARRNPRLRLETVDPDRQPRLADVYGVRLYNAAVVEADGRRIQVQSTDDREITLGILRVLRQQVKTVCFLEGHGEYSVDNFEYHTHFETLQTHSHSGEGQSVVLTERHGVGRLRRALEGLGLDVRKIVLATQRAIPPECAAVVSVNPRTTYLPGETDLLEAYLAGGGRALLMYDVGFAVEPSLAALLVRFGVALPEEVVVDPVDHYSTDVETLAVPVYEPHPITEKLALTFYPGARPIEILTPLPGVTVFRLFTSSKESYTRTGRSRPERVPSAAASGGPEPGKRGPRVLAVAIEGSWASGGGEGKAFRVVLIGDADFASNSFFPYMANSDLAISMLRWIVGEEQTPTLRPRVPVLPLVTLTKRQMQRIFIVLEILLPGAVIVTGVAVWWKRR